MDRGGNQYLMSPDNQAPTVSVAEALSKKKVAAVSSVVSGLPVPEARPEAPPEAPEEAPEEATGAEGTLVPCTEAPPAGGPVAGETLTDVTGMSRRTMLVAVPSPASSEPPIDDFRPSPPKSHDSDTD